jgi:hypothetical protein
MEVPVEELGTLCWPGRTLHLTGEKPVVEGTVGDGWKCLDRRLGDSQAFHCWLGSSCQRECVTESYHHIHSLS